METLHCFSPSDLRDMVCGEEKIEWDEKQLLAHVHPVGAMTKETPAYKFLIKFLLDMDIQKRSQFLDFITSCPRLPPGGMSKFHMDVHLEPTARYPRSRACANQLYLPGYTTSEELRSMLTEAMHSSAGHHEAATRIGGGR